MSDEKPSPRGVTLHALVFRGGLSAPLCGGPTTGRELTAHYADITCAACEALMVEAPEMRELLREFMTGWERFVRENDDGAGDGVMQEDPLAVKIRALLARLDGKGTT